MVTDAPTALLVIGKDAYMRTIRAVHEQDARDKVALLVLTVFANAPTRSMHRS